MRSLLKSGLSIVVTILIFMVLAEINLDKIDVADINKKATSFYRIYKPERQIKNNKVKSKNQKRAIKKKRKPIKDKTFKKAEVTDSKEEVSTVNHLEKKIVDYTELEQDVVIMKSIVPEYPNIARKAGIECRLLVEVIVNEKGNVDMSKVVYSSKKGYGFENNALKAVDKLRFKPVLLDGKAVKVKVIYPIEFVLVE
ncbi:MAG: energy transducer TonB [bacterium]|nr:energy transducer TonB [bacterium]